MAQSLEAGQATNTTIAWLALLVAVVAMLFAVAAFNRTGRDAGEVVVEETEDVTDEVQEGAAIVAARTRLAALQAELAAERGYEEAAQETAEVRADLAEAYTDASGEVRQEWQELDAELERFEQQARAQSADAIQTLQNILERMQRGVLTDED